MTAAKNSAFLKTLEARGALQDVSHREDLESALGGNPISFYCGFDPTAESLHVGNLLPMIFMRRIARLGHQAIALVGTGTGMIGDPSGKSAERVLLDNEAVLHNASGIESQLTEILSHNQTKKPLVVHNHTWISKLSLVDFLRDVGKHFSVNAMIAKDSVKARLDNREQGISYTEFSYMLLQAYDFLWLSQNHGCRLQIGGSDQWGNITAGLELIRRAGENPEKHFGMTFPLLTTSSGTKFGKTEEGAIWLDKKRTSVYKFFQFWLNTPDADIPQYLNLFSEKNEDELEALVSENKEQPQLRKAQRELAREMTNLVHSESEAQAAEHAADILFSGKSLTELGSSTLVEIFDDVPSTSMDSGKFNAGADLIETLVESGLFPSKGAAKRSLSSGGIYLNNNRIGEDKNTLDINDFVDGTVCVLRSGKKNYHLLKLSR